MAPQPLILLLPICSPAAQIVAVLSAALQGEVASQLSRRKSRNSFGLNRKSPPAAPAAAPAGGGLSTVSEAAASASGRRSFEDRDPRAATAGQGRQQAQGQAAGTTVPADSQGCCVIA